MENDDFLLWRSDYHEGYCVIKAPVGVERSYQLERGISRIEGWPDGVFCRMSPSYPKDIDLSDNLYGAGVVVVSARIRDFLAEKQADHLEFLPVAIENHKGRVASTEYFILNPVDLVDCIDVDASEVMWNPINSELISGCKRLVIESGAVAPDRLIFRPLHWPMQILIRRQATQELIDARLKGLVFRKTADYTGVG